MKTTEKISVFEYRRRKAEAEMKKAEAQQQIVDLLIASDFRRPYAEEVAEGYHSPIQAAEDGFSQEEVNNINHLLKLATEQDELIYQIEQTTILY